jgi:hypothetical protein
MNSPEKILLIHLYSNGDCLYATAVARQIKQDHPGCHLTWVIASWCKAMLDNNPYVDEVQEVQGVNKENSNPIQRRLKKEALRKKKEGVYDEVYLTQLIDDNIANYDGCIRSGIFRGYDKPITVPITPVLRLRDSEIEKAKRFAEEHHLANYKNIVLFEFAPQSAQILITPELAISISGEITQNEGTAVILSSGIKIGNAHKNIIDGSALTIRETAALTHYCTLILGCSSGISWASTSEAGKQLPMVQMLDPYSPWVNPMSRDFERFGLPVETVIELYDNDVSTAVACVNMALKEGFSNARKKYYSPLPLHFIGTRRAIYNLLCFLEFGAIIRHIRINIGVFGWHPLLIKEIIVGFVTAPFKLIFNLVKKHLLKSK